MENVTEKIKDFLDANGYKVTEIDEDGVITVLYQMNVINICTGRDNPEFISVMLPGIDALDESNPLLAVLVCMRVVSQQMVVKAFPVGQDNVVAAYEFFYRDVDDLYFHIEKAFKALLATKVQYRKYKKEIESE